MRHPRLVLLLLIALVLAPFLGQVHGVLHVATTAATAPAAHANGGAVGHAHDGLAALFGDHVDRSDCRLYDQLGHGDLGCGVPALALPEAIPPAFELAWRLGEALARFAALFDARGPPPLR